MQSKPYRESSALVQMFTRDYGRVAGVFNGARRRKGAQAALQTFNEVEVGYSGKGGLVTLSQVDVVRSHALHGDDLAGGFYLFELLARLLKEHDPHPQLFAVVKLVLAGLAEPGSPAVPLRLFERRLLEELGFGLDLARDSAGNPVDPQRFYQVDPYEGVTTAPSSGGWPGRVLIDIAGDRYDQAEIRTAAREIFAALLAPHLGDAPLASRALLSRSAR